MQEAAHEVPILADHFQLCHPESAIGVSIIGQGISSGTMPHFRARASMRRLIEVPIPIRIDRLTEIVRIKGVPVYVHWSVLAVAAFILINVIHHPLSTLVGLTAYLGVLLIHETGHLVAAQRMHYEVFWIKLYPIFGITEFQTPWSRFDHCVIAWGGVIAQAVVAIPIVIWIAVFGFTPFPALNAVLGLLGFFSLGIAAFNLLPVRPLDGATAWYIIPEAFKRARGRGVSRPSSRRY